MRWHSPSCTLTPAALHRSALTPTAPPAPRMPPPARHATAAASPCCLTPRHVPLVPTVIAPAVPPLTVATTAKSRGAWGRTRRLALACRVSTSTGEQRGTAAERCRTHTLCICGTVSHLPSIGLCHACVPATSFPLPPRLQHAVPRERRLLLGLPGRLAHGPCHWRLRGLCAGQLCGL